MIAQNGIASAKRTKNERSGVHGWHPYYAGYSEKFVATAIKHLNLTEKNIVLDPWVGSGTTNLVCDKLGIPSVGIDINPAMVNFASGKQSCLLSYDFLTPLIEEIKDSHLLSPPDSVLPELREFFSNRSARLFTGLIQFVQNLNIDLPPLNSSLREISTSIERLNPIRAFLLSAVFITARTLSGYSRASNPTWYRVITEKPEHTESMVKTTFIKTLNRMHDEIQQAHGFGTHDCNYLNQCASALGIPHRSRKFDAVITSPPYLTRIDYAVSTKLELLLLGGSKHFRDLRERTMGAPIIRSETSPVNQKWGSKACDLMSLISEHGSKASKSYYVKNISQYFEDAYTSLNEIHRVLKGKGVALVVVQSSYYKEHEIQLGEIYVEMGKNIGFNADIVFREEVKGHMAHVNSKSSLYKKDKVYFEDVVSLTK